MIRPSWLRNIIGLILTCLGFSMFIAIIISFPTLPSSLFVGASIVWATITSFLVAFLSVLGMLLDK